MKQLEIWAAEDANELEKRLDTYCRVMQLEPVSASITFNLTKGEYVMAVVFKPLNVDEYETELD